MNKIMIIGNVCRAPESRVVKNDIPVCTFTVAVNNKKGQVETTEYFRCTAWRKLAELCAQYLDKGRKVAVVGSVSVSAYKDKQGECKASLEVTADEVEFLKAVIVAP